ncbi:MAG TPA: hypothetical protein VEU74_05045, partial [Gemmatimonadales bacterium]|nr:hypothetical protein [Gemmatimonadales bacterium]
LQYDSAAAEFAAQLAPNRADILYLYGVLLMTRRSFDAAAEQFRLAIEADPYYVKPYFPLAGRLRPHGTP